MTMPLTLELHRVMAVRSAKIELAGLTVLCGVNSTGKSTIAHVFQDMVEYALYYKQTKRKSVLKDFAEDVMRPLLKTFQYDSRLNVEELKWWPNLSTAEATEGNALNRVRKLRQRLETILKGEIWRSVPVESRFYATLCSSIGLSEDSSHEAVGEAVLHKIDALRDSVMNVKGGVTTIGEFNEVMSSDYLWKGEATMLEKNEVVWKYNQDCCDPFTPLASVSRVFYLESPYATEMELNGNKLKITNNFIEHEVSPKISVSSGDKIIDILRKAIKGEIVYKLNENSGAYGWMYVRDDKGDKKEFPLERAASGIRSLANLFRLYSYGLLDEKTVLVLDEPEAHLHPSWVVTYAELIVRLVKDCGLRVLLASHSPDFVNALKSFALAAEIGSKTRFYQANESKDDEGFDFEPQELDIGNIFDSFNVVYGQIEQTASRLREEG